MTTFSNYLQSVYFNLARRKKTIFQLVIVFGVIFASLAVAIINPSQTILLLVAATILGLFGIYFILQWPSLGLILTIIGGFFIKFSGPSNINITVLGVLALIGLWLAKMFILDREIKIIPSSANLPIFVFLILSVISFGVGLLPLVPYAHPAPLDVQIGGLIIFILSAGTFLFVANNVDIRWLEWLTWAFVVVGGLYMCGRLLSASGFPIGRPFDPGATTGSMFWTWITAIAFSQVMFNNKLKIVPRAILGILVTAILYIAFVISNDWKSGWVPAITTIVAILAVRYWKIALFLAPFGLIAAGALATMVIGTDTYSWGTRVDAWLIVIEIAKISPIFGLGFANYYWYSLYFPIRGYFVPFNSHSQYIDIIAQTGVLGLLSFLWIFLAVGRLGWQLREKAPDGFPKAYVYGVIGGIAGTLVAASLVDWVLPFAYNIGFSGFRASILPWVFMGGLVCIEQFVNQNSKLPAHQ